MIRYERTKSSIFLMEIILNLLLFSVLCVCSLQFFMKAYKLTEETTTLHHAVTSCSNIASIYESGNGDIDIIYDTHPYAMHVDEQILIYLDKDYNECDHEHGIYYILIDKADTTINKIDIRFYKTEGDVCYSLQAYNYQPLTPSSMAGGVVYE